MMLQQKESLNSLNPYDFSPIENGYTFTTSEELVYTIYFCKCMDSYPIYSFSFDKKDDKNNFKNGQDICIRDTILTILKTFFENDLNAILYACE